METIEDNDAIIDPTLIVREEDLTDWATQRMAQEVLEDVLHTLTPREEYTIRLRFGFIDGRPRTLEEVGREFDITRERVRQIEAKALRSRFRTARLFPKVLFRLSTLKEFKYQIFHPECKKAIAFFASGCYICIRTKNNRF